MLSFNNNKNIINAKNNEKNFRELSKIERDEYIEYIYKNYNKKLPLVEYNLKDINNSFQILCNNQKYHIVEKPNNYDLLKKYNLTDVINFIEKTEIKKITIKKKIDNFCNFNFTIIDDDYKYNYVHICALSDFYNNKWRVKCVVKNYISPEKYYTENYKYILNKYFSNQYKFYEKGLKIKKLSFKDNDDEYKNSINAIFLQNIMYEDNKFCTVYKPYLFKLLINLFCKNNGKIIDLSSGWGDRLLGILSVQDNINLYIGIDPNKRLFRGYNQMISDLCNDKNKNKIKLINEKAEEVNYINFSNDFDIIFWSPPFFDKEIYVNKEEEDKEEDKDNLKNQSIEIFNNYNDWENYFLLYVINLSARCLKKNGVVILYLGNIDYDSFIKKINNNNKFKKLGNINILGDNIKNYIILLKITEEPIIKYLTNEDKNIEKYKIIKHNLKYNEDNPPFRIETINLPDKKLYLIQEGVLIAGTKQRVCVDFIKNILNKNKYISTLVYAGTFNGFGAIATAYASYKLGLKCKVFLSEVGTGFKTKSSFNEIINSKQINTLQALNAKIYLCPDYRSAKNLEYDFSTIKSIHKNKWINRKDYYIVPIGLNDNNGTMIQLLSKKIKEAILKTKISPINLQEYTGNFWLVAGSGGIVQVLSKVFINNKFYIYLTGGGKYIKKVIDWSNKNKNIIILNNNKKFKINDSDNDYEKYYSSVKNYDSEIWPYVKKYGNNNDIIWNISDEKIYEQ
jgi:tRNA1(Val) A37 N6-methylase TrmN6